MILIPLTAGIVSATLAHKAGDYVIIVFSAFAGSFLMVYSIAYTFNIVHDIFVTIEFLKAGSSFVS